MTYCWAIAETPVSIGTDGIEVRVPNEPVRALHGPIDAAVAAACASYGPLMGDRS
jgi:hypothetical protein